jgi:hypothetical protein
VSDVAWLGRIVAGRYRVDACVSEGEHATVYRAWHLVLDQAVALKRYHRPASERWDAELRAVGRLRHPHILGIIDKGRDDDGAPFLVLDWCDGGSLRERLDAPREPEEAARVLLPLVDAVAHAHAQGIVHGDLKPENILFEGGGEPRVADWDASRHGADGGAVRFTAAYAAPEQIAGTPIGPFTDVHALALLFLEVVSGRRPYGDVDPGVGAVDPLRPSAAEAGAFEPVLRRALSLAPADRQPDASMLATELRALRDVVSPPTRSVAPDVITSPSDETAAPASRTLPASSRLGVISAAPSPRWRTRALLGGVLAVVLAGVIAFVVTRRREPPPEPALMAGRVHELADVHGAVLATRLRAAGLNVQSASDVDTGEYGRLSNATTTNTPSRLVLSMQEGAYAAWPTEVDLLMANVVVPPPVPEGASDEEIAAILHDYALRTVSSDAAASVAYAGDRSAALVVWAHDQTQVVRARDAIVRGVPVLVSGVVKSGDTELVAPVIATKLLHLNPRELEVRLRAAGYQVTSSNYGAFGLATATFQRGNRWAALIEYGKDIDLVLESLLMHQPQALVWARDDDILVVVHGDPELATRELLAQVLVGLGVEVGGARGPLSAP